ncbi:30S ribosomal protein S11 [candidate division WOR-3 bacterium]|nr:30S ribosomal protein S11 [candidate division WOR-3 bacterium]
MARKAARRKPPAQCVVHISTSFNNTLVTVAEPNGAVLAWSSAGRVGFKGAKKGTPYAAGQAAEAAGREAAALGVRKVEVRVSGPGPGREAALRSLQNSGLDIISIRDITPIPHNGCRPPKQRRV